MDYKNTLNLPRTDFAMKADLVAREPQRLARWEADAIYAQIRAARAGQPKFILHDGPPFANGDVHVGTALNKVLKDIIVKYKSLRGFDAPYIPGWDCHGLPIEFKVTQDMRKAGDTASDAATIRTACDAYARKYIDLQRTQFKRLGVFGDWQNPYLTLNKEYEADELRLFADLVAQGFVYRGKKPVYWSIPCRTALAEAEVEYADHVSQSVYVKFKLAGEPNTFLLIWTTTPWTLPANLAVAFNPSLFYSRIHADGNVYLVCNSLLETVVQKCAWPGGYQIERTVSADELATLTYEHPFCARTGRLFPADFVTADTGTGFVHIAPGHGADDYNLGRSQGLPIYSPVDDAGCLAHTADLPADQQMPAELLGKSILEKHGKSDANDAVLHELRVRNALAHQENYHHSYPHCWRSKTPIIFRAMDQWFIRVDLVAADVRRLHSNAEHGTQNTEQSQSLLTSAATFREKALAEIDRVNWIPDWGKNRIEGAVKSRPDWCISRQRSWGVPIPAFYDAQGEPILDAAIVRRAADLFEQHGSNVWFEKTATELWQLCRPANWTGREATAKSSDTLDVWIDSGSSSRAVLMRREELQHAAPTAPNSELQPPNSKLDGWQADVYLEGSDQHRGWFHTSLLESCGTRGRAPFDAVLTHGFVLDEKGRKMSKSLGNVVAPQDVMAQSGADILRLWVVASAYEQDLSIGPNILKQMSDLYRRLRNTLRYLLGNLSGFTASERLDAVDMPELERLILHRVCELDRLIRNACDSYDFHGLFNELHNFCAVELSAFYFDIRKDVLYCDAPSSTRRRACRTVLDVLYDCLVKWLAPFLCFTTEEAWLARFPDTGGSVHLEQFPNLPAYWRDDGLAQKWAKVRDLRRVVTGALELERAAKKIGASLQAHPKVWATSDYLDAIKGLPMDDIGITSAITCQEGAAPAGAYALPDVPGVGVLVELAAGQKCLRCWKVLPDVGSHRHPGVCERCMSAVDEVRAA